MKTKPMTMLLMMIAGWMNREQQHMIEYLREENKILRDELSKASGKKRITLNVSQRRRLAILAKKVGRTRKGFQEIASFHKVPRFSFLPIQFEIPFGFTKTCHCR
jgi:hypothetical protein